MELKSPIASSDQPETGPLVLAEISSSAMTTAATHGEHLARREDAQHVRADEPTHHRAAPVERHVLARPARRATPRHAALHQVVDDQRADGHFPADIKKDAQRAEREARTRQQIERAPDRGRTDGRLDQRLARATRRRPRAPAAPPRVRDRCERSPASRRCESASSAAPDSVVGSTVAREPKIKIEPTYGKMVVPRELKACAKVRRLLAVAGRSQHRDQRIGHHLHGGDAGGEHEQREQEQRRTIHGPRPARTTGSPRSSVSRPMTAERI